MVAAIDRYGRTGDEVGVIRGQKDHSSCDILGLSKAAAWDLGDNLFQHVGWHGAHHIGVHITRGDRIDGDTATRALQRQRFGKAMNTGFCGGVVDLTVLSGLTVN